MILKKGLLDLVLCTYFAAVLVTALNIGVHLHRKLRFFYDISQVTGLIKSSYCSLFANHVKLVFVFPIIIVAACVSNNYMGISLDSGNAEPALQVIAKRARLGDKAAQLQLGIAFEQGDGVARDLKRARRLYLQASSESPAATWIFTSRNNRGRRGAMFQVRAPQQQTGLAEAKARLKALEDEQ